MVRPGHLGGLAGNLPGRLNLLGKLLAIIVVLDYIRIHDQAMLVIRDDLTVVSGMRVLAAVPRILGNPSPSCRKYLRTTHFFP